MQIHLSPISREEKGMMLHVMCYTIGDKKGVIFILVTIIIEQKNSRMMFLVLMIT